MEKEATCPHYTMPYRLMGADGPPPDPLTVRFGRVTYRFPDPDLLARWREAPETPPEAWGARAERFDGPARTPRTLWERVGAAWRWVWSLRVRNLWRTVTFPLIVLGPMVMLVALRLHHGPMALAAFVVSVTAVVIWVDSGP